MAIHPANGTPGILPKSSPAGVVFQGTPLVLWNGSGDDGIWAAPQLNFTFSAENFPSVVDAMSNYYNFQATISDQPTISTLQAFVSEFNEGNVTLNNNSSQDPPNPNVNPPVPVGFFNNLSSNQITFLTTLCLGLIGYAIYRYNRIIFRMQGIPPVLLLEFANNNNNPAPVNIPLLPIGNVNQEL